MKKVLLTLLAAATVLVACDKTETAPVAKDGSREVHFTTNIQTYTVKAALDDQTVTVVAGAPINATTNATAKDSKLTPATKLYWAENQTAKTKFAAIYPAVEAVPTGYDLLFGEGFNYDYQKEVLVATSGEVTPGEDVALTFKHPFSKIEVTVTAEGLTVQNVKIGKVKMDSDVDLLEGTFTAKGDLKSFNATKVDAKYLALIIPQSAKPEITVTAKKGEEEAKDYKFVLAENVNFVANKVYTAAITVTDSTPEVGEEVSLGFNVTEWDATATPMTYTPAEPDPDVWSVIGAINGTDWDEDFALTEGTGVEEGKLVANITFNTGSEFKIRLNGSWDSTWGAADDTKFEDQVENSVLVTPGANIRLSTPGVWHITFNPTTKAFTATKTSAVEENGTMTLYVSVPWEHVYVYTFKPERNGSWPGVEMTDTETVNEVEYRKITLSNLAVPSVLHYIFNNNGSKQTADLSYKLTETGAKKYVVLTAEGEVTE